MTPAIQKSLVKNLIMVDESLDKKMNVGAEDAQISLVSIQEYNERGVGTFTRKRKLGPNGRPRYTLRVGNIRVLVEELESSEGARNFGIVDIRRRKDVYSKNEM